MTPKSFTAFAFGPAERLSEQSVTHRVEAVAGAETPEAGWLMTRIQSESRVETVLPLVYQGGTQDLRYTSPAQKASLAHAHGEFSGGATAVIIPIRKSEEWWALPEERRRAHFRDGAGHTHTGAPYVDRVYRKLFHSRGMGLPYDFVTYFEFAREDADYFRELLAGLRDPQRNPEWRYVEWECEFWLTKL